MAKQWRLKHTLRGHYDGVRSVAFSPSGKVLFSASEDSTVRMWNLSVGPPPKKGSAPDIEPVHTFRGHKRAVLSVAAGTHGDQDVIMTGGLDGTARIWPVPPHNTDMFSAYNPQYSFTVCHGHTDAVWDVRVWSRSTLAATASADGTVGLWSYDTTPTLLRMLPAPREGVRPTSVDFVADGAQVVVAYSDSSLVTYDVETGKQVVELPSNETYDGTRATQINRVVSHPTKSLAITAHEDKYIRCFDVASGSIVSSFVAHRDSVHALAVNPSGTHFMTGGHDASIRGWDMNKFNCVQEFSSHRRKYAEAVNTLAFHETDNMLASGGADAFIKVYQ